MILLPFLFKIKIIKKIVKKFANLKQKFYLCLRKTLQGIFQIQKLKNLYYPKMRLIISLFHNRISALNFCCYMIFCCASWSITGLLYRFCTSLSYALVQNTTLLPSPFCNNKHFLSDKLCCRKTKMATSNFLRRTEVTK